jgi:DNA-binding NarL/FixJ family response regulator
LAEDIRSLHGGGSPINPMIARHVLRRFRMKPETPQSTTQMKTLPEGKSDNGTSALSARELDALGFIAKGFTYDEVATLMGVSRNTVMTFVRRIYGKLEVKSKAEAIHEAYQRKLINH